MINTVSVDVVNPVGFYDDYRLTDEDIDYLFDMAMAGQEQEAIDTFISENIIPPGTKYSDLARRYLELSTTGVIEDSDRNSILRVLSLLAVGLAGLLYYNYSKYTKKVYSEPIFEKLNLKDKDVQKAILNVALNDYKQSVDGAMAQTSSFVLGGIRAIQRDMIVENLSVKRSKLTGEALNAEIKRFKSSLKTKYPYYYKGMEDGNILVSRKFTDGTESVRHYKLDYYADMATRTTMMNVDRTANMIMAHVNGDRVMEFVWTDHRPVKKDREICQEVLANKINGKSLLALDEEAAEALGIMTVEEAMNTPDYVFGPFCRHSVAPLGREELSEVNKLIEQNI